METDNNLPDRRVFQRCRPWDATFAPKNNTRRIMLCNKHLCYRWKFEVLAPSAILGKLSPRTSLTTAIMTGVANVRTLVVLEEGIFPWAAGREKSVVNMAAIAGGVVLVMLLGVWEFSLILVGH
jgi:hypothetical protein